MHAFSFYSCCPLMWQAAQHCVLLFIPTVFIIYCCLTNHPKLNGLTQQQFVLFHNSVSQEFRQDLLGTSSLWSVSWAYSCGMTDVTSRLPGLSSRGLESFSSPAWTSPQQVAGLPGEEVQAASPCVICALQVSRCHSHLILFFLIFIEV